VQKVADDIEVIKTEIIDSVHFIGEVIIPADLSKNTDVGTVTISPGTVHTAATGDVALQSNKMFIWAGSYWREFWNSTFITEQFAKLTSVDEAIQNQFVTQVSQANGKISVQRATPTVNNISYDASNSLYVELTRRATEFNKLNASSVKYNTDNSTLYVGEDETDSIVLCCGTAADL
jgi:hypothetical protein